MKDLQRFALSIEDSEGRPQRGEVVLARRWNEEWGRGPLPEGASFLIVILREPPAKRPSIESVRVGVCPPLEPVGPLAVREALANEKTRGARAMGLSEPGEDRDATRRQP